MLVSQATSSRADMTIASQAVEVRKCCTRLTLSWALQPAVESGMIVMGVRGRGGRSRDHTVSTGLSWMGTRMEEGDEEDKVVEEEEEEARLALICEAML